jgi:ribosomal protein RSM22 (predicted rRNA methylase)
MNWRELDWTALDRLRAGFLSGSAANGPYWNSEKDLLAYDLTYAQRIGWKWDAVLDELKTRGWSPRSTTLLDWGCGSGIATRKILSAFPESPINTLRVHDHSRLAREYARSAALKLRPNLEAAHYEAGNPPGLLVLSHVVNELSPSAKRELLALCRTAEAIIWVEPGTHAVSRELLQWREQLRETFAVIAPCTHQATCGLLTPENERHWCHYFAPPPANIYADSDWVKFGQRAGIDLRSLPYSFLVLEKKSAQPSAVRSTEGASRVIGYPRHFKGYAKMLSCDQCGVCDLTLQKRTDPAFFKALEDTQQPAIFRLETEAGKITRAQNW